MIVPKAQSLTGELTLAPVSTPIKEFFNNFRSNVQEVIKDTFNVTSEFQIVDYFNFLDYEDMHNVYILSFEDIEGYLYFDIAYNTVSRVWRILTYETKNFLYPYKHDATQTGTMASTSLLSMDVADESFEYEIIEKKPVAIINTIDELVLAAEGFDISFSEPILIRIFEPSGELDREIVFSEVLWDDSHKLVFQNEDYVLESEIEDTAVDFRLKRRADVPEFYVGSQVVIYKQGDTSTPVWGPKEVSPGLNTCFLYDFESGSIIEGSLLEIDNVQYTLDVVADYLESSATDLFKVKAVDGGYMFCFADNYILNRPSVKLLPSGDSRRTVGRCIQLYKFDSTNVQDYFIPMVSKLMHFKSSAEGEFKYALNSIKATLSDAIDNAESRFTFNNWQFLDTGYRNDSTHVNKRFRELQLQVNNVEGKDLKFGMEFLLDGERRMTHLLFETEYVTDEFDPNRGLIYVQTIPIENIVLPNSTDLGMWTLNQSLFPELSLWKVRVPVSGKGLTPRLRLLSKNPSRFELPGINWIYRMMNMR